MPNITRLLVALLYGLAVPMGSVTLVADGHADDTRSKAAFILDGWLAGWDKVETAVLELECERTIPENTGRPETWKTRIWIDKPNRLSRFERSAGDRLVTLIRSPTSSLNYIVKQNVISRYGPTDKAIVADNGEIDVRLAGIGWLYDFQSTGSVDLVRQRMLDTVTVITSNNQGHHAYSREYPMTAHPEITFRETVIFNEQQGFTPFSAERVLYENQKATGIDSQSKGTVVSRVTCSWNRKSGCWVPMDLKIHENLKDADESKAFLFNVRFIWQAINTPIDQAFFAPESLGAPDG